jgi:hypothetical protein
MAQLTRFRKIRRRELKAQDQPDLIIAVQFWANR